MKKILFVANTSWSLYKFRKGLIERLVNDGFRVYLAAPHDEYAERLTALGAGYVEIRNLEAKGSNLFRDIRLLAEFYRMYKRIRPDLIFHYTIKPNIYGTLAAFFHKIPSIAVVTGLGYTFINKNIVAKIAIILYRMVFRLSKEVWFLNEEDKRIFVSRKLVKDRQVFLLNGEGVDTAWFSPAIFPEPEPDEEIRFCLIARLLYDKGILEYVKAAEMLKKRYENLKFQVLGYLNVLNPTAVKREELEGWIKRGILEYLGSVDDVRSVMQNASCIVLPSYREGMSMVLMESASMAKPIITTDIPGCRQLVDDGETGFLCRLKDPDDLAAKMEAFVWLTPRERQEMGYRGREKMLREFDVQEIIRIYLAKINNFLPSKSL